MYFGFNEGISYIGYSVIFLSIVGILYYRKSKERNKVMVWFWLALIFALFSVGPLLSVYTYGLTDIPGIYVIYHYIPLFNLVREPGRFDLFVTLSLAVLSGFGIDSLFKRMKSGADGKARNALYIALLFAAIILIEYNGMPAISSVNSLFMNTTIPSAYNNISPIKGNYSVLMLPDSINSTLYPAMLMYYQTTFKKPIIGAYTARTNQTEIDSVAAIPLSKLGANPQILLNSSNSTIENYSNVTLQMLSKYNVSIVGIMNGAYNSTERGVLFKYMSKLFGAPIYQSNSTTLFSTTNSLSKIP
jgi:hypothetical protein